MEHSQMEFFKDERDFLEELRNNWKKVVEADGGICPCCDRSGKVYRLSINQTYALSLRWIDVHGKEGGWINVQDNAPRFMLKGKNYGMLTHWGVLESFSMRSGIWRTTQKGKDFLKGLINLPLGAFIYNDKVWAFSSEEVSFRGCFDKHFDFDEMMSAQFKWSNLKERKK